MIKFTGVKEHEVIIMSFFDEHPEEKRALWAKSQKYGGEIPVILEFSKDIEEPYFISNTNVLVVNA